MSANTKASIRMQIADCTAPKRFGCWRLRLPSVTAALLLLASGCSTIPISGCVDDHVCVLQPQETQRVPAAQAPEPEQFVGIAISGGGSRSAVFAEAVLEALASISVDQRAVPTSLLERVKYISSVSGGSLAAAYYGLAKQTKNVHVLDASGNLSGPYTTFFGDFQASMKQNWQTLSFLEPTLLDATGRAFVAAREWDKALFHGATFSDLGYREANGDSPLLILNGTSWDSGRRVLFTNLPDSALSYDFIDASTQLVRRSHLPPTEIASLVERLATEKLRFSPITPDTMHADISKLSVSIAVATSASLPLLIGPVLYSVGSADCNATTCYHVGDGGMFDNQGIESLSQVVFADLMEQTSARDPIGWSAKRALMIIIDGSFPINDVGYGNAPSLTTYLKKSPSRISDIMEARTLGYQALLWSILRSDAASNDAIAPGPIIPDSQHLQIVYLRHIDAAKAIATNPKGICGWTQPIAVEKVAEYLGNIPTRFSIDTQCDVPLLQRAAVELVNTSRPQIQEFFKP